MSQGNDFANYSAAAASGSTGSEDVWFVAVASDDIKQMSVDQLDEAFRLGVITAETAVWTEGMEAWAPLGQVADLDANAEETSGSVPVAGGAHAGHRHDDFDSRVERHDAPAALPPVSNASVARGGFATMQSAQHSFAPGPSSISPVTSSYAPSAGTSGPVALNVDEDMPAMRHGRRFRPERWALAAAALVAIGVVGYNNMFSSSVASAGTQAPAAAPAAAPVSRGYDSADGVEPGEKMTAKASATESEAAAPVKAADEPSHVASAAASSSTASAAKASADDDAEEAPATTKKGADKESLKGSFSKAFNKKAPTAKAAKVKPRSKAASRATTKARATKAGKKPGVARSQSAFDPLNDSLP
ncbi:MAG TPA: DUF4339 domain-containing protein [Polyangiaceae bacterium]|nr:DUF4339 domain-containing protein [Polyangiaceae bacterium]